MELKHGGNGVGGDEILKLGIEDQNDVVFVAIKSFFFLNLRYNSKRRRFGLFKKKKCIRPKRYGLCYKKKRPKASLHSPMTEKMEKNLKMLEARPLLSGVVALGI